MGFLRFRLYPKPFQARQSRSQVPLGWVRLRRDGTPRVVAWYDDRHRRERHPFSKVASTSSRAIKAFGQKLVICEHRPESQVILASK